MIDGSKRGLMQVKNVRNFLDSVLDEDIHTKRIASLANATLGVMTGASLGVAVIGKSLAQARGLLPKHAVKQVDRGRGQKPRQSFIRNRYRCSGRVADWLGSLGYPSFLKDS